MLENEPGAELLAKILAADLAADDPATINAFLATLDASEEAALAGLLTDKPPRNALAIAHDAWRELERRRIRRRMEVCQARLRQPGLGAEEVARWQKEVFDLQSHLSNLARLFSPPP
jgi:DNA primase